MSVLVALRKSCKFGVKQGRIRLAVTPARYLAQEVCLRFEILSMYLLTTRPTYLEKYDEKMAHKACSQVMEPLLNAYVQAPSPSCVCAAGR